MTRLLGGIYLSMEFYLFIFLEKPRNKLHLQNKQGDYPSAKLHRAQGRKI